MKKIIAIMSIGLFSLFGVTGCQKDLSSSGYDEASVGDAQTVLTGIVVGAEKVQIKGDPTVATVVGAGAGGIGGSYLGGGARANLLGGLGGAVVGGLVGREVGKALTDQTGMRYLVRLDEDFEGSETTAVSHDGRSSIASRQQKSKIISVTQGLPSTEDAASAPRVGDPVLVLMGSAGRSRVVLDRSRMQQRSLQPLSQR